MKAKRWYFLCAFVFLTTTAFVAPWLLLSTPPRFTEQQCRELKDGMTEQEAIALLGCASGDYTAGKGVYVSLFGDYHVANLRELEAKSWADHHGAIVLYFDGEGKVTHKEYSPAVNPPPTVWGRIKSWFVLTNYR